MNERRGTKGLELWCRKMTEGYPGVKIDNMTTSWRDGLAFCAIIHHFRPDLIDFSKLNKDDVYHNNELAFRVAEEYLGIPALLEPEDMVEYAVPDRLSILTYLSQFYQAFAVREGTSSARIAPKRPQVPSEHGIVSPASTSPPTKVALTVGKQRREPCAKCGLPVFIAERLNVGKSLFHRTCFRCARCNSELILGDYYETENSQYCCEICPDEEKIVSSQKAVLQRSMSDEEKSASLSVFTNEPDKFSTEFETALENADAEKVQTLSEEFYSARSDFFRSQIPCSESSDSAIEDKEEESPDLPKSSPPSKTSAYSVISAQADLDISAVNEPIIKTSYIVQNDSGFPNKDNVHSEFNLNLSSDQESQNVVTKEESSEESLVKTRRRLFENNVTDIKADVNRKTVPLSTLSSIPVSIKNDLRNISDINKDILHSKHNYTEKNDNIRPASAMESPKKSFISSISLNVDKQQEIIAETLKDNVLPHAANNENDLNTSIISVSSSSRDESNFIDTSIQSLEEDNKNNLEDINSSIIDDSMKAVNDCVEIMKSLEENGLETTKDETVKTDNSSDNVSIEIDGTHTTGTEEVTDTVNYNINTDNESEIQPQENFVETINYNVKNDFEENSEVIEAINTHISETSPPIPVSEDHHVLEKQESYPVDLNPFDEDQGLPNQSSNPFGSEDEEEEKVIISKKPVPSPRLKKKIVPDPDILSFCQELRKNGVKRISVNPFESDDEEKPVPVQRRKKISVPKISLNPFSSDDDEQENIAAKPVPLPRSQRNSGDTKRKESLGLSNANHHFGSNSSISSGSYYGSTRKKRPAPKPPVSGLFDYSNASSLTSTPSQSVQHSPRATPKYRKNKKAPLPPQTNSTPIYREDQEELIKPSNEVLKKNNEIEQERSVEDELIRNKQSLNIENISPITNSNNLPAPNKSTFGKWKRKKGQAPTKPVVQKRTIKCLPMTEIKKELEFIEVQLQGLEKQGVRLELIIRDKCEGTGNENTNEDIPIEVEDLILQLFELVNEKNELFRKQTELMYLKRQQRLEEEHADVEYEIRYLMMLPEAIKTDSDKAREEQLIKKLVDIVERRNKIVECLEMDRIREAEEDDSISNHINLFAQSRENNKSQLEEEKKQKDKDKKKLKKEKKSKHKNKSNSEVDKSVKTSGEKKEKKKFNLF
ncbi:putative autophagy-related protein 11 [Diorhabda sublineata]|uniref:putative autophagy-related protein 11 n=1 Tax=Diorhabda sublineata TaxID=1163346 RepID=UPI0024E0AADA|nr:putative autophagy-related protein 11 [Diorhabda sublineata]